MNKVNLVLTLLFFGIMATAQEKQTPVIDVNKFLKEHWSQQETNNAKVVVDFFQKLMNDHDFEYILKEYGKTPYLQHNRAIPNGVPGLVEYVKDATKRYPEYSYDLKRIVASNNYIVTHSHVTFKTKHRGNETKGFIITDTYLMIDGKMAEHWDAIQPIDGFTRFFFWMIGGKVRNNNSTF